MPSTSCTAAGLASDPPWSPARHVMGSVGIMYWRGALPTFVRGHAGPASEAAPESEEETRKGCCFRGNLEAGVLVLVAGCGLACSTCGADWLRPAAARRCRRGHRGIAADPLRPAPDGRRGSVAIGRALCARARARAAAQVRFWLLASAGSGVREPYES